MDKNNNKKTIVIVISILIVIILLFAIAYAYFSTQLSGTDQIVKVGELELVLNEISKGISLENAIGLSDSDGMKLTPSTFELKNNGNKAVDYTIYLDDNTIGDTDTRIDDKYLKYNLNKNGTDSGATLLTKIGSNPNRVLDTGTIEGGETNKYSLNLWITDEVDGNYSGQVFSGKLRVEVSQERPTVSEVLLANISEENLYDDGVDTFITGENPNNYIWYSGKLWRAVSVNNEAKTTKLVTQWNISSINFDNDSSAFDGSYMEEWLNDTTVDGFLGNLRKYENFIVTDSVWDATLDDAELGNIERPNGTSNVTNAVGLLNIYEYQSSSGETSSSYTNSYLNNGLCWGTLTPYNTSYSRYVDYSGNVTNNNIASSVGVRPVINLKSTVKIVDGDGTIDNSYRLNGDNDTNLSGTLLNTRYSGEYITFGIGENNLYRIVSHENGIGTKITSVEPLKSSGTFIESAFDSNRNVNYSSTNTIGAFLNGNYLTNYVGNDYSNMIEDNTIWYLGTITRGSNYKLSKYSNITDKILTTNTTTANVGLLRFGELMAGMFDRYVNNANYWFLTPSTTSLVYFIGVIGSANSYTPTMSSFGIKPSINLKSNVIITSGDGTKQNPFQIKLTN